MTIRPRHRLRGAVVALLVLVAPRSFAFGQVANPQAEHARNFLTRHCVECHGAQKPKGDLRLDALPIDFAKDAHRERWLTILKRVQAGEMPPKGRPRPPAKDVQSLSAWITASADAAESARGRVVLRRLNR